MSFTIFNLVQDLLGLGYPMLASAKAAIQEDGDSFSSWIIYWLIYACLLGFEKGFEWLVSWIPFYAITKLAFISWLALPRFQGAARLYDGVVAGWFSRYESQIDEQLSDAQSHAKKELWAFLLFIVTEASQLVDKKVISIFSRLFGIHNDLDMGAVTEESVLAVTSAMGKAFENNILKTSLGTAIIESPEKKSVPLPVSVHPEADSFEVDSVEGTSELLCDFVNLMNDGVYLNVSCAASEFPRLRIVTLSKDRWRILWANLQELRSGSSSSLHICTV